jgi:hypothetical protein
MTTQSDHSEPLSEEPQEERGAPGSRDTGSDEPSGGPVDRPSGTYEGDESVPAHSDPDNPQNYGGTGTLPPQDTGSTVPPYEGRKGATEPGSAPKDPGSSGATRPVADPDYKSPSPGDTPGGATASPADEQPASGTSETDRDDDRVGPGHTPGTGRAEDKL